MTSHVYRNVIHLAASDVEGNRIPKLSKYSGLLVVYAPWCGHCKSLRDTWEKLAAEDQTMYIAVNSDEKSLGADRVAQQFLLGGYPTIRIFCNGEVVGKFQDSRTEENLRKAANAACEGGRKQ